MKRIIIFLMILCLQFYVPWVYSSDQNLTWPTPVILEQGQTVQEDVYIYTESDFDQLLWLEGYYKIMEKRWVVKEKIYNDALKKAQKKLKPKFWNSFKGGFITGIALILVSAWAVGQLK